MTNVVKPFNRSSNRRQRTLRLTFRSEAGKIELVSRESVDILCPPFIGERPVIGRNGGFWLELRDGEDKPIFYRHLESPYGDSVEVHSPDGKIQRVVGEPVTTVFMALVPDDEAGRSVVLVGEPPHTEKERSAKPSGSQEIARFPLSNE